MTSSKLLALCLLSLSLGACKSTTDTDTDTGTDTGTDTATDTGTDTGTAAPFGTIVVNLVDTAFAPINGATVTLGDRTGTTVDGFARFDDVPAGQLFGVSGRAPGGVAAVGRASVLAGESVDLTLVAPEVQSAAYTPGTGAQSLEVGPLVVGVTDSTEWVDPAGNTYTGEVTLRTASGDNASAPPSVDLDENGDSLGMAPVITTFDLTAVSVDDEILEPTEPLTVEVQAPAADPAASAPVWSFDEEKGIWVLEGEATNNNDGTWTAALPHLTTWRIVNGARRAMGGFILSVWEGSTPSTARSDVSWRCVDPSSGEVAAGSYTLPRGGGICAQALQQSVCEVTVNGLTETGHAILNGCVCNWSNQQCAQIHFDVARTPVCGNGVVDAGEQCDDGNTADGDGCDAACLPEGCTFEWTGSVANVRTNVHYAAQCDIYTDGNGTAMAIVASDGNFDLLNFSEDVSWWSAYASGGAPFVAMLSFGQATPLAAGTTPMGDVTLLGASGVGSAEVAPSTATGNLTKVDTNTSTFDFVMDGALQGASPGAWPPPASTTNPTRVNFNAVTATDATHVHVWGRYREVVVQDPPATPCDSSAMVGYASDTSLGCPCFTAADVLCLADDWVVDGQASWPEFSTVNDASTTYSLSTIHIQSGGGGFQANTRTYANNPTESYCYTTGWGASDSGRAGYTQEVQISATEYLACKAQLNDAASQLALTEAVTNN